MTIVEARALTPAMIRQIILTARNHGFSGFGGDCGEAAIAINRVIFGGKGTIIGAFNKAFFEHGYSIGHIAVLVKTVIWDADGVAKSYVDIEHWGMLDPGDGDYAERAAEAGFAWNDETASEIEMVAFDNDQEVLEHCQTGKLDQLIQALTRAKAELEL